MIRLLVLFLVPLGTLAAAPVPASVGFEQRNGEQLPVGVVLTDAMGASHPFGTYLGTKPVVLIFNYFRCPEMCSLVSSGAIDALRALRMSAGKDFVVVTVSIDPTDTPAMARERQGSDIAHYGRAGAGEGWHTLVGTEDQVTALANAAGFHFRFDPRSRQYAHPSGLVIVTPRGIVSRYFMGVDFPTQDMATALRQAAANETGSSVFSLLFVCFQGGAAQGRYSKLVWIALWSGVGATLLTVFGGIGWMLRQERRGAAKGGA